MSAAALAWRLLRRSGGRGLLMAGLSVFAVAVSTALLLLTLGVNHGFAERGERESWLYPVEAKGDAAAIQAVSTDFVQGQPIAIVDLAALEDPSGDAPAPPGMQGFPEPGEVWMSPALADLSRDLPPDQLADRFDMEGSGNPVAGELERQSLVHPEQLVAVVGRSADDPALSSVRPVDLTFSLYSVVPTQISNFDGSDSEWKAAYQALSAFATALLIVPLIVLGAAAGRLASARREKQLAAMRLVGATPGQVGAITTFETVLIGTVGAILGAGAYLASLPFAAQVSATGGTWFVSDLWVGPGVLATVLAAVPLAVGASALVGLRRLVISPLGVARRQIPRKARVWRLVLFVAVLAAYGIVAPNIGMGEAVPFAVFFGVLFLALSVLGPFAVGVLGRAMAAFARGPKTLLAGRRLVEDPHSAWRTVGGITLAAFVAGFMTIMIPQDLSSSSFSIPTNRVDVVVQAPDAKPLASQARVDLRKEGIKANVSIQAADMFMGAKDTPLKSVSAKVRGEDKELDRARTALWDLSSLQPPVSAESTAWTENVQGNDVRIASLLVLAVTLAVASASAAITGVTGVLDRRQTYGLLRLAGTPLSVLDGARLRETLAPLSLMGGGALMAGIFCATPLAASAGITPDAQSLGSLAALVAFAALGVAFAELASGLTLRATTREGASYRE